MLGPEDLAAAEAGVFDQRQQPVGLVVDHARGAPAAIEIMRRSLVAQGRLGDATLISVLAYAGLRPGEALALTDGVIRESIMLTDRLAVTRDKFTRLEHLCCVAL